MLHKKRFLLTSLAVFALALAQGQVAKSPYSTFGVGDIYGNALAQNQGMAGVGISNPSSWYINNQNPALLIANYVTSFQAGLILESRTVNDGIKSLKNGSGNLNYLVMAFPVKPGKWTTSLGLMPYSGVNYKVSAIKPVEGSSSSTVLSQETGSGGINQLYWANGVKVHKNVALGVRVNYLFSSIITESINVLSQTENRLILYYPSIYERNYVKDFSFSTGAYFHKDSLFKKNYRLNLGVVYDFKTTLSTQRTLRQDQKSAFRGSIVDSVTLINNEPGSISLPQTLGLGISFGRVNHWTVGADLNLLDYSQFKGFRTTDKTTTGIKTALGFEYIPDPTGLGNYLKRMTYRTGVSYEKYPYLVGGNQVKDLGVNFGVSLPVGRLSTIDLSLKIGKRGTATENLIEENYFKLYFGMTFNDQWFIKRKFD
jgi:hypothetical protein